MPIRACTALAALGVVLLAGAASGAGAGTEAWPLPNHDLASTRAATASAIGRSNVRSLRVAWRFPLHLPPVDSGAVTATPVVDGGRVYLQDMRSNVYALDLESGRLIWRHSFGDTNPGPNGLAVAGGSVYGSTDTTLFALSASVGRLRWTQNLVTPTARFVDIAPQVARGVVYTSTVGLPPAGRGVLYAVDARTGRVRWKLDTIRGRWRVPAEAGGGGAWYPPSVAAGTLYWGTANPYPYGGTRRHPNGGAYAGRALYTDSLLAIAAGSGRLSWFDQVTPHDVRDHDLQLSPVLGVADGRRAVFAAGKGGIAIAWDRSTHRRLWQALVGRHLNDSGPLPTHRVQVCPGLFGGVLTPMAYAYGRLFLPVVNLCSAGSAYGYQDLAAVDPSRGTGALVALDARTGRRVWVRKLPLPDFGCATVGNGVVFTSTFDGTVYALDAGTGAILWKTTLRGGVNACPALTSNRLLVPAGIAHGRGGVTELVAFEP